MNITNLLILSVCPRLGIGNYLTPRTLDGGESRQVNWRHRHIFSATRPYNLDNPDNSNYPSNPHHP
ncbi:MAG: hypothetical protein RIM23_18175 [Coleofasciculus sp. G3-WIS-01]|uniref:hypothetical protein n=1 Tax=Coleofasciculus sp. G3-WIS-01 TaxID=3069528 RepID=UPI0032FD2F35